MFENEFPLSLPTSFFTREDDLPIFPFSTVQKNLNIGMERVIVPPFKPLVVNKATNEVRALLTGYKLGGALWDAVYADGENILAEPVEFLLDGQRFSAGPVKLISAEADQVVYETSASQGKVKLKLRHEYDYDGIADFTYTDKSGLSLVAARIFPHQHGALEDLSGFLETEMNQGRFGFWHIHESSGADLRGSG